MCLLFNVNGVVVIPPVALDNGLFDLWFGNVVGSGSIHLDS